MRLWTLCLTLLVVILIGSEGVACVSPYSVLQISQTASMDQIQKQYRKLRSRNRRSRSRKLMIKQAYNQILFERQFEAKEEVQMPTITPKSSRKGSAPGAPTAQHIDQTYVYGYTLREEYDDGRYFDRVFNETQFIIDRLNNSQANKKTARFILMIGGMLLKLIPCFILCCICRGRLGTFTDALERAGDGYRNVGRRGRRQ